jgi:hypothetical protein
MNAVLLSGDLRYLDIPRGQLDRILDQGRVEQGQLLVPHRYTDTGWTSYRPLPPKFALQIWYLSQDPDDDARLARFPERHTSWREVLPGRAKGDDLHLAPWYCYLRGDNPAYPQQILDAQWSEMARRMERMRHDDGDPEQWDVHHWQEINPVHTEALVQLTCGGPQIVYHGGLLHTRLRHFDAEARRPGLPPDVAVLVHALDAASVSLALHNTSPLHERRLILQAGAFGEHHFTEALDLTAAQAAPTPVDSPHLHLTLPPGRTIDLRLGMRRFAHTPSYAQPV